jgi:hypothetical protein
MVVSKTRSPYNGQARFTPIFGIRRVLPETGDLEGGVATANCVLDSTATAENIRVNTTPAGSLRQAVPIAPDSALRLATPMRAGHPCHPLSDKGGGNGWHRTAESEAPVRSSARRAFQTGSIQVDCNPLKALREGGTTNRTRSCPTARRSAAQSPTIRQHPDLEHSLPIGLAPFQAGAHANPHVPCEGRWHGHLILPCHLGDHGTIIAKE